jgi:hypothetical protein
MKSGYFFFFFPPLFSIKNAIAGTSKFRNSSCLSRLAVGERPQGYFPVVFALSKAVHIPTKLVSRRVEPYENRERKAQFHVRFVLGVVLSFFSEIK